MPSGRAIRVTSPGTDQPEGLPRHGAVRWPWRVGAGGLTALSASALVHPRDAEPLVVLFDIDGYGWSFLLGVATALLTAGFIGGVVHLITRGRDGWCAGLARALTAALLALSLLAGFPLALLGGLLSFKNSYREVGAVDGHAIVVQQFAGWRGADFLDAGYRNGLLVSFDAQNDSHPRRTFTDIRSWEFQMATTATTVVVHYRSSDQPEQAGTLTLPRAG